MPPTKSQRTRARILDAALSLMEERGWDKTTVRTIAKRARCATGLIYRYFPARESFAIALYEQITTDFAADIAELPSGTVATRFREAMERHIAVLEPHKAAFIGLLGTAFDRRSAASALGPEAKPVRDRVMGLFLTIVRDSDDAPETEADCEAIARTLFVLHLTIQLAWTQDRDPHSANTVRLVGFIASLIAIAGATMPWPLAVIREASELAEAFLND